MIEKRIANLRVDMMRRIRRTDLLTMENVEPGRIHAALTSDVGEISESSRIMLSSVIGGLRIAIIYVTVGFVHPPALILMLLTTCVGGFFYISGHSAMMRRFEQIRGHEKKFFEALGHLLDGFRELRLDNRKSNDFHHRCLAPRTSVMRELRIRSVHAYIRMASVSHALWTGLLLAVTLLLPLTDAPPHILAVTVCMILNMPMTHFISYYPKFHQAYLSMRQIREFETDMENLAREPDVTATPEELAGHREIVCEGISFAYRTTDGHPFSVGPLSMSFRAGETLFITGGNGSGKSTLLKLITGLYHTASGRFLVNGKEADIRAYRELFGVIFTDFHLFDRLYGMTDIDEERLRGLLRRFGLEKRVTYGGGRFSTLDLSTGQRKRLAMVTVMMEDKPVYVFDEWAADQDPHFREHFYGTLLPEFKAQGKSVIAVTHDDRHFHTADRVIKMEYGQIVGT